MIQMFDFICSSVMCVFCVIIFFFFNDTATTEIYTYRHTLSLHDALPISWDAAAVLHLKALHVIFCYRFRGGMIREIQIKVIDLLAKQHRSEEHTSEPSH